MTQHDRVVLSVSRNLLKDGARNLKIGKRVVARQKIITKLQTEFPDRKIAIGRQVDIET